jgi:two-component system, NarL family, response regulator NreC
MDERCCEPAHVFPMQKLRILLADDHETVRAGLKAILNAQPDMEVIAEALDGEAAVTQTRALAPDVVIMDISMPRLNGLQTTEMLTDCCPQVKILTLTRHAEDGFLRQLLRAGAKGYVLKQSRATELLTAIRAVAGGGTYLDPAVAASVVDRAGSRGRQRSALPPELSGREEEVLRLIAWGYSNKEIAGRLELAVKTIETHKTNAMTKLGLRRRIDIVRYALLRGWLKDP